MKWILLGAMLAMPAAGQMPDKNLVPLMRPDEEKKVSRQSVEFNTALEEVLADAARSTVRIWGNSRRPSILAYGTVVGNGSQVLTKWSEVERFADSLQVQTGGDESFKATVAGVFSDEDLVLLDLGTGGKVAGGELRETTGLPVPAKFHAVDMPLGKFLSTPQPNGKPAGFGVVSVLERNLRDTDQAHLGIFADQKYRGDGVRILNVQPEYGAAEAGLRSGDVILKVGERAISGLLELKNALASKQPGDTVAMVVETAGKERDVEVMLSNRPVMGQFSGERLTQMETMGGEVSRVRAGFSKVVQSDMRIPSNQVGGPVVDLSGRIVGITIARADRTRTYMMGSREVMALLKREPETVAEARAKLAEREQLMAKQQRAFLPRPGGGDAPKPRDAQRMRRHLGDTERLTELLRREMEALEVP